MQEGYPENWVRGTLICNPETKEIHALDGERDVVGRYKLLEIVKGMNSDLEEQVKKLEKTCDELYDMMRGADDYGVENDVFCEEERATGPHGIFPELEQRWVNRNPLGNPPVFDRSKTKDG